MSTQLIVYPQNYQGVYNASYSYYYAEFITNGQTFSGFDSTGVQDVSTPGQASVLAIQQQYAASYVTLNAWYRWHTSGVLGTTTEPVLSGTNIVFPATPSGASPSTGVFQLVTNLVVGVVYTVSVNTNLSASAPAILQTTIHQVPSGNTMGGGIFINNGTSFSFSFTAQNTMHILALNYYSASTPMTVTSISLKPSAPVVTPTFSDGQVICDLYEEEDIPLTLSVDEFKNVAEQVKSYSKDFNLPATKRNNQIFNNMFEVTRSASGTTFNPYVKTKCVLKQDGFLLFEGFLRMTDVKDDEGEISYNVNLYSEVIALAETLDGLTFSELDFTELEHDYNKTQIKYSWNDSGTGITYINAGTSGFRDANDTVKYPFIDWEHQYILGGTNPIGNNATVGNPELSTLESSFRPCIQLRYLINMIFSGTEFEWSSAFFDSTDFGKLYMDFNWGGGNAPLVFNASTIISRSPTKQDLTTSYTTLNFNDITPPSEFGYSSGVFTAVTDSQTYNISFDMIFKNTAGEDLDIEWVINGVSSFVVNVGINPTPDFYNYTGSFTAILNTGDTILCKAKSTGSTMYLEGGSNSVIATTSSDQTTSDTLLGTLRGETGQWEFLKGIMTMFNLVSMKDPTTENRILIEPYSDVFIKNTAGTNLASRGIEHDWTTKVDVSQMELMPLTELNKTTIFKFAEDEDDHLFSVFKNANYGHLYGSKVMDASLSAAGFRTILDGTKEITAEPFSATVSTPIMPQFTSFIVPAIYAKNEDGTCEGFDNSPRIFYNNGEQSTGTTYFIPAQNGLSSENQPNFLQFSHLSTIPTSAATKDFVFQSQQLVPPIGAAPVDNLYSIYWQPYFNELYNADTRTLTMKVNLSPSDVADFDFSDNIFIKNRTFRVNKIEYKPNSLATVEFILLP
tara:strand:+ start:4119 stop:6833 length:2715 start_codon:yes stop_codon:yes gene_type:complete